MTKRTDDRDSVISARHLTLSYGDRRGIRDVNLEVSAGEIFGFLGPNGAGKSTTIRVLLGFLRASSGSASIFGQDCWSRSAIIKQNVGYVPGDVRLYPWLTARRGFQLLSEVRGEKLLQAGLELAERFQLEPDLPVRKMSRGNRQKVALVLALVHRPRLVILDEPTSGLDPLMQDTLIACLREMAKAGHTVFFSSHTLSEVEAICDRVAIVRDGSIVSDESLSDMKQQAPRSVVLTFRDDESAATVVLPEAARLQQRAGPTVKLLLHGTAAEFLRWASQQTLVDISIGVPDLETLFRQFYHDEPSDFGEQSPITKDVAVTANQHLESSVDS
jgi:ABC-2 type transport system ATP-binding protein